MQWFCMCARASVCGSGVCVCVCVCAHYQVVPIGFLRVEVH